MFHQFLTVLKKVFVFFMFLCVFQLLNSDGRCYAYEAGIGVGSAKIREIEFHKKALFMSYVRFPVQKNISIRPFIAYQLRSFFDRYNKWENPKFLSFHLGMFLDFEIHHLPSVELHIGGGPGFYIARFSESSISSAFTVYKPTLNVFGEVHFRFRENATYYVGVQYWYMSLTENGIEGLDLRTRVLYGGLTIRFGHASNRN